MEIDKDKGLYININGKQIPSRISVGSLFNCESAIVYFSIFIVAPLIFVLFSFNLNEPIFMKVLRGLQSIVAIVAILGWIYGINDLCKLRKKGFFEINFAFISFNLVFLFGLIFQLIYWQTSGWSIFMVLLWGLIVFLSE